MTIFFNRKPVFELNGKKKFFKNFNFRQFQLRQLRKLKKFFKNLQIPSIYSHFTFFLTIILQSELEIYQFGDFFFHKWTQNGHNAIQHGRAINNVYRTQTDWMRFLKTNKMIR